MGEVWRARHQLLARPCAVKLVRPELLGETGREQALERFGREARTIARLGSPHTVRLYDFGVSETGNPYFVMELLDGLDLHSLVTRHGPLPPGRVVAVLRQVCRSLAEAHQAGLLHRDVKPQNVLLCRLGIECDVAKVLDFGLAKSIRGDETQITGDGAVTGTPAYMPPERVVGEPADERSDLYSLGLRRVLPAHRPAGLHGRADGRDDPPRALDAGSAVGGLRLADAPRPSRGWCCSASRRPPRAARPRPWICGGVWARCRCRRKSAGPASGRRRGGASTRPRRRRPPTPTRATAWTARRADGRRHGTNVGPRAAARQIQ